MIGATGAGALLAVFRVTQPGTQPLRIQADISSVAASAPTFVQMLELYTGARIDSGNAVDMLLNGAGTYPRLWSDLWSARQSITVQTYYARPGAMTDTLSVILRARARVGVRVLVLLDAFGSQRMPESWLRALRRAGVRVAMLRPLKWQTIHGAADRSHVRAVVVDGRIGYTGGFGFADYWRGDGRSEGQWRETNARVEGPVARQLQATFAAAWLEATGELLTSPAFFPVPPPQRETDGARVGLLYTTTTTGSTAAERFVAVALLSARERLFITNSYFVPNDDLRRLLTDAVRRGVDVRVLTTSGQTDVATTRYARRHHYEELLRAGVRIYEYRASMVHAKTMSVDGVWSAIGSMNFDNRSLAFNDESTLVVYDTAFAQSMEATFADDLAHAHEITLPEFSRRSRWERMLETGANLLAALL
jgi:cardiolipin synthase